MPDTLNTTDAGLPERLRPPEDPASIDPWESDHTALVHVLWHCQHAGLTLADDPDEIARRIMQSKWLAATRKHSIDDHQERS